MTAFLAAAGLALLATAGPTQGPSPEGPRGPDRRPGAEAGRMIDAYVVSNLQESLGLTDEQFVKLLPLVKRLQNDRRDFVQRRGRTLRELRRLLNSGTASETQVSEALRELKGIEIEEPGRIRRDVEVIDAALTPLQQAKFRVMELEIERKIRDLMNQIRRAPGRPADRPARDKEPLPEDP